MDLDQIIDTNGTNSRKRTFKHKCAGLTLKETLLHLKSKMDEAQALKSNSEPLDQLYREEFIPYMLQLRRLNRDEKDGLHSRSEQVKDLNSKIMDLQHQYDSLAFEASCQLSLVGNTTLPEKVSEEEHTIRMRSLDEEEVRRKEFEEKLTRLNEETMVIEQACTENSQKLAQVKPYVKQLVEKVVPLLNQ